MAMLEARLKQLEDAFNTNTKAFSDGIQMIEAQQEVLRRVLEDLCRSERRVKTTEAPPSGTPGRIDFNAYLKEYIAELAASEEKAEKEKANGGTLLVDSDSEQPYIFGG